MSTSSQRAGGRPVRAGGWVAGGLLLGAALMAFAVRTELQGVPVQPVEVTVTPETTR